MINPCNHPTPEVLNSLQNMICKYLQHFHLSKPCTMSTYFVRCFDGFPFIFTHWCEIICAMWIFSEMIWYGTQWCNMLCKYILKPCTCVSVLPCCLCSASDWQYFCEKTSHKSTPLFNGKTSQQFQFHIYGEHTQQLYHRYFMGNSPSTLWYVILVS